MKKHIRSIHALLGTAALLVAVLVVGCQDQAIPVAPITDDTVALGKKGGGGGGAAYTVTMTGGLVATAQDLDSFKENKRQISGTIDVFNVGLNLMQTKTNALGSGEGCSFTCDDPSLDCAVGGYVYNELANAFVSGIANHPTVATSGYTGLNIGFNKNAVNGPALSSCPFTGIADFDPPAGGGVIVRNCRVTGDLDDSVFTVVDTDPANTVSTARRFETDGSAGLGPQDYRASLACPLLDAFTVTFASK